MSSKPDEEMMTELPFADESGREDDDRSTEGREEARTPQKVTRTTSAVDETPKWTGWTESRRRQEKEEYLERLKTSPRVKEALGRQSVPLGDSEILAAKDLFRTDWRSGRGQMDTRARSADGRLYSGRDGTEGISAPSGSGWTKDWWRAPGGEVPVQRGWSQPEDHWRTSADDGPADRGWMQTDDWRRTSAGEVPVQRGWSEASRVSWLPGVPSVGTQVTEMSRGVGYDRVQPPRMGTWQPPRYPLGSGTMGPTWNGGMVRMTTTTATSTTAHPRMQTRLMATDGGSSAGDGRGRPMHRKGGRRRRVQSPDEEGSTSGSDGCRGHGRRQILPDKFDGTSVEWPEYLSHFQVVAEVNRWDDLEKGLYLASSLTGEARRILTGLKPTQHREFDVLVERLGRRFDPACQEESHRAALRGRTRKSGETPQTYAQVIRRLVEKSYPQLGEEAHETIALESFLKGHTDGEMKLMALMRNMQTLEEAVAFVTQYESVNRKPVKPIRMLAADEEDDETLRRMTALLKGGRASGSKDDKTNLGVRLPYFKGLFEAQDRKMDKILDLLGTLMEEGKGRKTYAAAVASAPQKGSGKECWLCKKPGHISRECPDRPKDVKSLLSLMLTLAAAEDSETEERTEEADEAPLNE